MSVIAVFIARCLVYDWRKNRPAHPVFAIGGIVLVSLWPLRYVVARRSHGDPLVTGSETGRHLS